MGVEQEGVQLEALDQVTETFVEEAHVVTFAHDPCDVRRFDAGGNEEDVSSVKARWRHVVSGLFDGAVAPQVVVEGIVYGLLVHPEEDVDAGRLDIGIYDSYTQPLGG